MKNDPPQLRRLFNNETGLDVLPAILEEVLDFPVQRIDVVRSQCEPGRHFGTFTPIECRRGDICSKERQKIQMESVGRVHRIAKFPAVSLLNGASSGDWNL